MRTVVPQTLEKRLEIVQALQVFNAQDHDEAVRRRRAEIAALRRDLGKLALAVHELQRACDPRLRSRVVKYSPGQPRLPAGSPHGGQWTSVGGGMPANSANSPSLEGPAQPIRYAALDTGTRTDAAAAPSGNSDDQVAAGSERSGYPIDLNEEEARGGHTIGAHVNRSEKSLLSDVADIMARGGDGRVFESGIKEGSFPSVEAANKLVNATIARNQAKVDLVASGLSPREELDAEFSSPTGYEAYARTGRSTPYIRATYGVYVVIVPDQSSPKGYRVDTAFPKNF